MGCLLKIWKLWGVHDGDGRSGRPTMEPYQAPVITPPGSALALRTYEDTGDIEEQGRLLGSLKQPWAGHQPSSSSGALSGAPAPGGGPAPSRHRRGPSLTPSDRGVDTGRATPVPAPSNPDDDDSNYCPTCLEAYTADNPKTFTACGHHYHLPCLYEWLERKDTCPMCESPLAFPGM